MAFKYTRMEKSFYGMQHMDDAIRVYFLLFSYEIWTTVMGKVEETYY